MAGATISHTSIGVLSDSNGTVNITATSIGTLSDSNGIVTITHTSINAVNSSINQLSIYGTSIEALTDVPLWADIAGTSIEVIADSKLFVVATAGSNGTISPLGTSLHTYLDDPLFTITPNQDYIVLDVLVDGVSVGAVTEYTFTNIDNNHTIHATFKLNNFDIVSSTGSNGTISPLGTTSVIGGNNQTYTITPNLHYHVLDVLVDSVSVGAVTEYTFTNVVATHTISCTFTIDTYAITSSQSDPNGSISPLGVTNVNYGSNQSYTITPDANFHVQDVLVDGVSVGSVTSYQFTNVTTTHTIDANFHHDPMHIVASSDSHSSITPEGNISVEYYTDQGFTWETDDHYQVLDITVDGGSQGNQITSYNFSHVQLDHTISVTSEPMQYAITSSCIGNGLIYPLGETLVTYPNNQIFNMTPYFNAKLTSLLIDGVSITPVETYTFSNVDSTHTIVATFETLNTKAFIPRANLTDSFGRPAKKWLEGYIKRLTGNTLKILTPRTISSSSATGTTGEICWDSNYLYICIATNTWVRKALNTW